jgi:hypothetical protein
VDRQMVTLAELNEMLTASIQQHDECKGSKIAVQYRLQDPDETGCNWGDDVVATVGPRTTIEELRPHIARVVTDARSQFNIKD